MHVFEVSEEEWIVARDMDDARVVCAEQYGEEWWRELDYESAEGAIVQCPDDRLLAIRVTPEGRIADASDPVHSPLRLSCGEWAAREPRGPLAALNY